MRRVRDDNRIPQFIAALPRGINRGLEELGDATRDRIDRGFSRGEDALGNDWEPLAPKTIALKGHDAILIEEGDLSTAFDDSVNQEQHQLTVSNSDPKAHIHEFGAPDENIPARPFMEPAAEWVEKEGMDEHFEPTLNKVTGATLLSATQV